MSSSSFQFPPPLSTTPTTTTSPPPSTSSTSSIIIVIIIIASAIIASVLIYLLLQLLSRKFHRSFRTHSDAVIFSTTTTTTTPTNSTNLLTSLPLFTFSSLGGNLTSADCAVCLSKFQPHDQLRLLPLCCHAFHSDCIDSWILTNHTCPLCRSMAFPSDADLLDKILPSPAPALQRTNNSSNNNSFRIEIGSVSNRRTNDVVDESPVVGSRSYSIGASFEYIVDENGYEVSVSSLSISRRASVDKDGVSAPAPPGEGLAAEVAAGSGRINWLRDYIDRASSSFRGSSGRFFSGSSRRNESVAAVEDLEASNRAGEEITEYFRWFSGY